MKIAYHKDRLTEEQARELLKLLSEEFRIPCPGLSWTFRSRRGLFKRFAYWISAGPLVWRGSTNCLLHEFAHALAEKRHHTKVGHDYRYMEALHDTVLAWFGQDGMNKYDWQSEYSTVAAYGRRHGG